MNATFDLPVRAAPRHGIEINLHCCSFPKSHGVFLASMSLWLVGWLVGLIGWLVGWLAGCVVCWVVGSLFNWLALLVCLIVDL